MSSRRRTFRVAERIRELVAAELMRTADPRFSLVTITSVVVSPDLRHAKVYWMVSQKEERVAEVEEAFASAQGMFRRILAKELGVRFVPELRFYYDDTIDTVHQVEHLLERIAQEGKKEGEEA